MVLKMDAASLLRVPNYTTSRPILTNVLVKSLLPLLRFCEVHKIFHDTIYIGLRFSMAFVITVR
jgi:hypothetical protein